MARRIPGHVTHTPTDWLKVGGRAYKARMAAKEAHAKEIAESEARREEERKVKDAEAKARIEEERIARVRANLVVWIADRSSQPETRHAWLEEQARKLGLL